MLHPVPGEASGRIIRDVHRLTPVMFGGATRLSSSGCRSALSPVAPHAFSFLDLGCGMVLVGTVAAAGASRDAGGPGARGLAHRNAQHTAVCPSRAGAPARLAPRPPRRALDCILGAEEVPTRPRPIRIFRSCDCDHGLVIRPILRFAQDDDAWSWGACAVAGCAAKKHSHRLCFFRTDGDPALPCESGLVKPFE